ncbi:MULTISPECIES: transposase [Lentzea]|uniref:transposase n=1 Tax=Lentzea TaxID=165301 RepID=UPI000B7C5A72|nr:transposase [Lentzea sp. DG1S-22]WVH78453.1 transposase [Lentzea sp. DG1S-22]
MSGRSGGRWEKHCRRVIVEAILYVVDNGIKWRALPADFPPWPASTSVSPPGRRSASHSCRRTRCVTGSGWRRGGWRRRRRQSWTRSRCAPRRPWAGPRGGWDGGKKVAGRKRHIAVDTMGLLLAVLVTPASTQDRVAARSLLRRMRTTAGGRVALVWADGGYTASSCPRLAASSPTS